MSKRSFTRFISPKHTDIEKIVADYISRSEESKLVLGAAPAVAADDYGVITHSSGTTGGMPKIVPYTHKMLHTAFATKWPAILDLSGVDQIVINSMDNLVSIPGFHGTFTFFLFDIVHSLCPEFLGVIYTGSTFVQAKAAILLPPTELVAMVSVCSLNQLALYGTFLTDLIRAARADSNVRAALQKISRIIYTGVSMNKDDEDWANANGTKVMVRDGRRW